MLQSWEAARNYSNPLPQPSLLPVYVLEAMRRWRTKWCLSEFAEAWRNSFIKFTENSCFCFSTYTFCPSGNVCCANAKPNAMSAPLGMPLLVTVGTATSSRLKPLLVCDERMQPTNSGRNSALLCCTMAANVIICRVGDVCYMSAVIGHDCVDYI